MEESSQRVAPGPYSLFAFRQRFRPEAGHADVFSGRPSLLSGSDFQRRCGRERAPALDRAFRPRTLDSGVGSGVRVRRHSARQGRDADRERIDMTLPSTPSQTLGPFFSIGLIWADGPFVVPEETLGAFWIRGRVLDGAGDSVPDALVETWQAGPDGRLAHPDDVRGAVASRDFRGFARCAPDPQG